MSLWDKYKVNDLPEEQRADVIKAIVHEAEETRRTRASNSSYLTYKGIVLVSMVLGLVVIAMIAHCTADSKFENDQKMHQPVVCPPGAAAKVPTFNIKVTPVDTATTSSP